MLRTAIPALLLAGLLSSAADPVLAQPGRGNAEARDTPRTNGMESSISARAARELARTHRLTGYRSLPPGIARNLARGKPLPPGLARREVPAAMLRGLPYREGYEWRVAGNDLIQVALDTLLVVELLEGVFR